MIFKILMVRLRNSDPLHKIIMKCHRKFKVFGRVDKIHINLKALAITSKRIYIYIYIIQLELSQCKILFYLLKDRFNINLNLSPINKGSFSGVMVKVQTAKRTVGSWEQPLQAKLQKGRTISKLPQPGPQLSGTNIDWRTPHLPKKKPPKKTQGHQNPEHNLINLKLAGKKNLWISWFSIFYHTYVSLMQKLSSELNSIGFILSTNPM